MTRRPVRLPLLPSRCPADVSAVVGPVVMGDDRGPWRWAVRGGPSGMAATWQEAWARVDEVRS